MLLRDIEEGEEPSNIGVEELDPVEFVVDELGGGGEFGGVGEEFVPADGGDHGVGEKGGVEGEESVGDLLLEDGVDLHPDHLLKVILIFGGVLED